EEGHARLIESARRPGQRSAAFDEGESTVTLIPQGVRRGRRTHGVWCGPSRHVSACGLLRGQDSPQGQAKGPAHPATDEVRVRDQREGRKGARPGDTAVTPVAG